jgi:hypothetical protein
VCISSSPLCTSGNERLSLMYNLHLLFHQLHDASSLTCQPVMGPIVTPFYICCTSIRLWPAFSQLLCFWHITHMHFWSLFHLQSWSQLTGLDWTLTSLMHFFLVLIYFKICAFATYWIYLINPDRMQLVCWSVSAKACPLKYIRSHQCWCFRLFYWYLCMDVYWIACQWSIILYWVWVV